MCAVHGPVAAGRGGRIAFVRGGGYIGAMLCPGVSGASFLFLERKTPMARIAVYEPAGCCSTGVCDPATSDAMAQFASAMEGLNKQGVEVERYELSSRPDAFAANETVKAALESDGVECLPLIIVDGEIVSKGAYLDKAGLGAKIGIEIANEGTPNCCGPADGSEEAKDGSSACCG